MAFGKTNFLAAWCQEAGPFLNTEFTIGYGPTNLWYPMIHGRVISQAGVLAGSELQISRAKWRQTAPAVAFDGTNYLVSWNDGRNGIDTQYYDFYLKAWGVFAQKLDQAGEFVDAPIRFVNGSTSVPRTNSMNFTDALNNYPSNIGPVLLFASNQFHCHPIEN